MSNSELQSSEPSNRVIVDVSNCNDSCLNAKNGTLSTSTLIEADNKDACDAITSENSSSAIKDVDHSTSNDLNLRSTCFSPTHETLDASLPSSAAPTAVVQPTIMTEEIHANNDLLASRRFSKESSEVTDKLIECGNNDIGGGRHELTTVIDPNSALSLVSNVEDNGMSNLGFNIFNVPQEYYQNMSNLPSAILQAQVAAIARQQQQMQQQQIMLSLPQQQQQLLNYGQLFNAGAAGQSAAYIPGQIHPLAAAAAVSAQQLAVRQVMAQQAQQAQFQQIQLQQAQLQQAHLQQQTASLMQQHIIRQHAVAQQQSAAVAQQQQQQQQQSLLQQIILQQQQQQQAQQSRFLVPQHAAGAALQSSGLALYNRLYGLGTGSGNLMWPNGGSIMNPMVAGSMHAPHGLMQSLVPNAVNQAPGNIFLTEHQGRLMMQVMDNSQPAAVINNIAAAAQQQQAASAYTIAAPPQLYATAMAQRANSRKERSRSRSRSPLSRDQL